MLQPDEGRLHTSPHAILSRIVSSDALQPGIIRNAMTVDVEDYFQVSAFEPHVRREDWDHQACRVRGNVDRILGLFDEHGVKATFFVLGWMAELYPEMVRGLADEGHEVASHGYEHVRVVNHSPEAFRQDIRRARALLEDTTGTPVRGYRAASYSIGRDNLWALDELLEAGHEYSSSIYPIHHDLYGMPEAPRFAFRHNGDAGLLEIPVTTVEIGSRKFPCGGGGYFRLFPYALSRWALRRVNEHDGQSAVFYFHPWEIDPDQPRQNDIGLKTRVRHYLNLGRTEARLVRLMQDFTWGRMDEVFLESRGAAS
jgi:polysaccharide deacetylase family protein (PEP-CTERM system associated)